MTAQKIIEVLEALLIYPKRAMPALPSSLITPLSAAPASTCTPEKAVGLLLALADLPDPRCRRGIRHAAVVVIAAAVCAVVAGSRSYTAIAEWVADLPSDAAVMLGIDAGRRPSEAMIRRLLQALDPDRLATVIAGWLATQLPVPSSTVKAAIAVDGKTIRGSRTTDTAARHVLAACDQVTESCSPVPTSTARPTRSPASCRCSIRSATFVMWW